MLNTEESAKVHKMYEDMYEGRGKDNPSMTTRMTMVEDKQERMSKNINKALWLAVTTLLAIIGEIVKTSLK